MRKRVTRFFTRLLLYYIYNDNAIFFGVNLKIFLIIVKKTVFLSHFLLLKTKLGTKKGGARIFYPKKDETICMGNGKSTLKQNIVFVLAGAFIGFINGFFGGGGGMVAVPVLIKANKLKEKQAHATSLVIILPLTIISTVIYLVGKNIMWDIALTVTAGVCAGGVIGALILKKTNNKIIAYIFCAVMLIAGIRMLF